MSNNFKKIISIPAHKKADLTELKSCSLLFLQAGLHYLQQKTEKHTKAAWINSQHKDLQNCVISLVKLQCISKEESLQLTTLIQTQKKQRLYLPLSKDVLESINKLIETSLRCGKKLYIYNKLRESKLLLNLALSLSNQLLRDESLSEKMIKNITDFKIETLYSLALLQRKSNNNDLAKKLFRQIIKLASTNNTTKSQLFKTQSHLQLYQTIISEQLTSEKKDTISYSAEDRIACRLLKFLIEAKKSHAHLEQDCTGQLLALLWLNNYYDKNSIHTESEFWEKFPYAKAFSIKTPNKDSKQASDLKCDHDVFKEFMKHKFGPKEDTLFPISKTETEKVIGKIIDSLGIDNDLKTIVLNKTMAHQFPSQNLIFLHILNVTETIDITPSTITVQLDKKRKNLHHDIAFTPKRQRTMQAQEEEAVIHDICENLSLSSTKHEIQDDVNLAQCTFTPLENQTLIASMLSRLLFSVDNDVDTGSAEKEALKNQLKNIIVSLTKGIELDDNPQTKLAHFFHAQLMQVDRSTDYWNPFFNAFTETFKAAAIQKEIKANLRAGDSKAIHLAQSIRAQTSGVDLCLKLGGLLIAKKDQHNLNHAIFEFKPVAKLFKLINTLVSLFNDLDSATKEFSEGDVFNEIYLRLRQNLNEASLYLNKDILSSNGQLNIAPDDYLHLEKAIKSIKDDIHNVFFQIQQQLSLISLINEDDLQTHKLVLNDLNSSIKIAIGWFMANAWSVESFRYHQEKDGNQIKTHSQTQDLMEVK